MRQSYLCFPGGKYKALTLSYDDGKIMDRRLVEIFNRAGIKATFHLNSSYLGESEGHRFPYITKEEAAALYQGHEIASHTCSHPTMGRTPMPRNLCEVLADRTALEKICGYPVRGFSYPNGVHSAELEKLLELCGIAYGRLTGSSERFDIPENFYAWQPTCHHDHRLLELTEKFVTTRYDQRLMLFYVWGHSYEFELHQNWELMEKFAETAGHRDDIWYATNIEIVDYLKAAKNLIWFADMRGVRNPSGQSVWLNVDGDIFEVESGQTRFFDAEKRNRAYYLDSERFLLYKPVPQSGKMGCLDEKLVSYRRQRPEKTTGNPYVVMGEPVGDMRDNMDSESIDLSENVSVREQTMQGVPVRLYETENHTESCPSASRAERPCLVYIHGGSFVGGSAMSAENMCKYICQKSGALVVNVDYRLAPETAFPDNIEDCMKVLRYVRNSAALAFDRKRLFLGGDSAGGNLALACAQSDHRENGKTLLRGLVLYYPVTDLSMTEKTWKWHIEDYAGAEKEMERYCAESLKGLELLALKLYVQNHAQPENPLVSPIFTPDFSVYPDMLVVSAEYDYLRAQVEAFARKAKEAGRRVCAIRYGGMNHAFVNLTGIVEQAAAALTDAADFLKQTMGISPF